MNRGDIFLAKLDPTVGDEIKKTRPVLIVSCNANNRSANTITIVPITSNVNKCYPFEVFLSKIKTNLPKDSKAQCHQIRTISKLRVNSKKLTSLSIELLREVDEALKIHLKLLSRA